MMILDLEQRSVVSAATLVEKDVRDPERDPQKTTISLAVSISRRGGGEIPPKHADVIATAATMVVAQGRSAATSPAPAVRGRSGGTWVQQGRVLVHSSHNVASRSRGTVATNSGADKLRLKGVRSEAAD